MKITMYGNGGAGNHGCEAISRGTVELLGANEFQKTAGKMRNMVLIPVRRLNRLRRREKRILAF